MPDPTCAVEGCPSPPNAARGWCRTHYTRWSKYGDPGPAERLVAPAGASLRERFERIGYDVEPNGCWRWRGGYYSVGYGMMGVKRGGGSPEGAHRVSYRLAHGDIPAGMHVCHRCDNRWCVNPDHLFLGTHGQNMADMLAKKRSAANERNGMHKLTDEEVAEIRTARAAGVPGRDLALKYGVTREHIYALAHHRFRPAG